MIAYNIWFYGEMEKIIQELSLTDPQIMGSFHLSALIFKDFVTLFNPCQAE